MREQYDTIKPRVVDKRPDAFKNKIEKYFNTTLSVIGKNAYMFNLDNEDVASLTLKYDENGNINVEWYNEEGKDSNYSAPVHKIKEIVTFIKQFVEHIITNENINEHNMKRQDKVKKLLSEGFSEKTLVNFSDKQLTKLVGMLSEQYDTEKGKVTLPKNSTNYDIKDKTKDGIDVRIAANETDLKESDKTVSSMRKEYAKLKGQIKDFKKGGGHVPEDHKRKMADLRVAINKKGSWHEDDVDENTDFMKKQHINKGFEGKVTTSKDSIMEWVDEIAKKQYTNLTLKKEIMEMVSSKVQNGPNVKKGHNGIPEFMTYDAIVGAANKKRGNEGVVDEIDDYADNTYGDGDVGVAEPTTKPRTRPAEPTTRPGTRPRPRTPFQPGPGPDVRPKARAKRLLNKKK